MTTSIKPFCMPAEADMEHYFAQCVLAQPVEMHYLLNHVYFFMKMLCGQCHGGVWKVYSLTNDGFFMGLEGTKPLTVTSPNGASYSLSVQGASIVATLFAFSYCAFEQSLWGDYYHLLYAEVAGIDPQGNEDPKRAHPEAAKIFELID